MNTFVGVVVRDADVREMEKGRYDTIVQRRLLIAQSETHLLSRGGLKRKSRQARGSSEAATSGPMMRVT